MPARPRNADIQDGYDPVFLHARREAVFILVLFTICLVWSVVVCRVFGYPNLAADATATATATATTWGMPSWVFWGILIPWIFADLATVWFCFGFMVDDPIDDEQVDGEQVERPSDEDAGRRGEESNDG